MKRVALAAALASWALPAAALVEPDPAGRVAQVDPGERDSRVRSVTYEPGQVIRLIGRTGQTLLVELPAGQEINSVLASDQDVMDGTPPPDEGPGQNPQATSQGVAGPPQPGVRPCTITANLQTCIRRERFLSFKPLTELSPQPIHVIALRARPNREPEELPYLFELETLHPDTAGRVAGGMQPPPSPYYAVRISMPAPPPAPPRPVRPIVRRAAPPPQPVAEPPPPPINRAYEVQGDRSLVGAAR